MIRPTILLFVTSLRIDSLDKGYVALISDSRLQ